MYDDLDKNIASLVRALNDWPGIKTVSSCGGHLNNKPHQLPWGQWEVMFELEPARLNSPSVKAWLSLETLAYGFTKRFGLGKIRLAVLSLGEEVIFMLEGSDINPDVVVEFLNRFRKESLGGN